MDPQPSGTEPELLSSTECRTFGSSSGPYSPFSSLRSSAIGLLLVSETIELTPMLTRLFFELAEVPQGSDYPPS